MLNQNSLRRLWMGTCIAYQFCGEDTINNRWPGIRFPPLLASRTLPTPAYRPLYSKMQVPMSDPVVFLFQ